MMKEKDYTVAVTNTVSWYIIERTYTQIDAQGGFYKLSSIKTLRRTLCTLLVVGEEEAHQGQGRVRDQHGDQAAPGGGEGGPLRLQAQILQHVVALRTRRLGPAPGEHGLEHPGEDGQPCTQARLVALGACCVGSWFLAVCGVVGVAVGAVAVAFGVAAGLLWSFRVPANGSFTFLL